MKATVRNAYLSEMKVAKTAYHDGRYKAAFSHLERAHILGQRYFTAHWITHWWMLKTGFRQKDGREVIGQILRLIAVTPGYLSGWVPKGNPGGASISALKPVPYPEDLGDLLKDYSVARDVMWRIVFWGIAGLVLWGLLGS